MLAAGTLVTAHTDRVRSLYDSTLKSRLLGLEHLRRRVRWLALKLAAVVLIPVVAAMMSVAWLLPGSENFPLFAGIGVGLVAVFVAFSRYGSAAIVAKKNYEARFKREVVAEICRVVIPDARYEPFVGMDRAAFAESGLFLREGDYTSDDRVRGRVGRTPFEAAEVKQVHKASSKSGLRPVFDGLFMQFALSPVLRGSTILEPRSVANVKIGDRSTLRVLRLDDEAFEREFQVYTNDESEARTVVSPAMMARLLDLRTRIGGPTFFSFRGGRLYVGIQRRRKLFQPGVARRTSLGVVEQMAGEFALAELVVRQLGLNEQADADSIDDSILRAMDAPRDADQTEALTSGTLTEEQYDRLENDAIRTLRRDLAQGSFGDRKDGQDRT